MDSFCIPILTYGIESFDIRISDYNYLDVAYNAAFSKSFSSFDKNVIRCCQFYCGAMPLSLMIDVKRLFYSCLTLIRNDVVHGLYLLFGNKEFVRLLEKRNLANRTSAHAGIWRHRA